MYPSHSHKELKTRCACRIKTLAKIGGVSGQVGQMKQLTAQLKKDKDNVMQRVGGLEKRIADTTNQIQVRQQHAVEILA